MSSVSTRVAPGRRLLPSVGLRSARAPRATQDRSRGSRRVHAAPIRDGRATSVSHACSIPERPCIARAVVLAGVIADVFRARLRQNPSACAAARRTDTCAPGRRSLSRPRARRDGSPGWRACRDRRPNGRGSPASAAGRPLCRSSASSGRVDRAVRPRYWASLRKRVVEVAQEVIRNDITLYEGRFAAMIRPRESRITPRVDGRYTGAGCISSARSVSFFERTTCR